MDNLHKAPKVSEINETGETVKGCKLYRLQFMIDAGAGVYVNCGNSSIIVDESLLPDRAFSYVDGRDWESVARELCDKGVVGHLDEFLVGNYIKEQLLIMPDAYLKLVELPHE